MRDQTVLGNAAKEYSGKNFILSPRDKEILQDLAKELAELAAHPSQAEKARLWTRHNDLEKVRPLVFCDPENGWNEIITDSEMRCESELGQEWEMTLRKEISWAKEMRDDKVIEAVFDVPYVANESDWGMCENRIGGTHGGAYAWEAPLKDYSDLKKLRFPVISVDYAATNALKELALSVFDGLLNVRVKYKWWWTLGLTMTLIHLRGLETMMLDMYDYPDKLHALMGFLRDGYLSKLSFLEENGLLSENTGNTYVGSGGFGFTKQLPKTGFDPGRVRLCDMWGFAESQETSSVSPEMFGEFIFPYQLPLLEKFGLNCYGCCEALEKRWKYIANIPNLRRISVSPWSNTEEMSEILQDKYIFSYKPNPAYLAVRQIDEALIRKNIRAILRTAKDCVLEIIMKDNNTLGGNPRNAFRWVAMVMEEVENM